MADDLTMTDMLLECVKSAGGSKVVGSQLWPEMLVDQAHRKLLDCLNDDRPHRLTPDQVLMVASMARAKGCHAFMIFCAGRLHYDAPIPRDPKDEAAELLRAFIAAVGLQQELLTQLKALTPANPALKAVF